MRMTYLSLHHLPDLLWHLNLWTPLLHHRPFHEVELLFRNLPNSRSVDH